jgi:hypothetical protein
MYCRFRRGIFPALRGDISGKVCKMNIYVAYKMDRKITQKISVPKGVIGVLPVFNSIENLKDRFGDDVEYMQLKMNDTQEARHATDEEKKETT